MIVNDIDITDMYHAIILNREIQPCDVITYNEWLDNSLSPIQVKKDKYQYSSVKVKLLLEEDTDEEVLISVSQIVQISTRCHLGFHDLNYQYKAVLESHSTKQIMKGKAELTLTYQAGKKIYKQKIEKINGNRLTIKYSGTSATPCILSITPPSVLSTLTITGLSEKPIIINHLESNKEILIDGELGKVTCEGNNKFDDYDAWEFPRLLPGENTVTLDSDICQVTITYKPLYL